MTTEAVPSPVPEYGTDIRCCRSCGSPCLTTFLNLGDVPLSGALLREDQLGETEPRYPLQVAHCDGCSLVQIRHTVHPVTLFCTGYPYFSSVSEAILRHSKTNVEELIEREHLGPESLVVEIASNDGYLLQYFAARDISVIGVDPASGPAWKAIERGIPTLNTFFCPEVAREIIWRNGLADVVIGNNVLAHVADLNGFVSGVAMLLKKNGVAVFEVPHVLELVDRCEFDTIYHEHLCYFSLTALCWLFLRHGMYVADVRRLSIHGGSLRVYVRKGHMETYERPVRRLLVEEMERGIVGLTLYADLEKRVWMVQRNLREFLRISKETGKRVVAYGAAAKGGTLLNTSGIGTDLLEYAVDLSPAKQGRYMAGSRLFIRPPEALLEDQPDCAVLLVWNFKDEVLVQQAEYVRRGGRFVLPLPELRVL